MKLENQNSERLERPIPHEGKIKVFSAVAWFCVILGFLAVVPGVCRLVSEANADKTQITLSSLSSFGSYLQGAVQSLWSLAAFLFIYVAFLGQKQQLKLQSEQFEIEQRQQEDQIKQQQGQLEDQRQQFKIQNESIQRQAFESSFFQLLNLHNQIVNAMRDTDPFDQSKESFGRACFEQWYKYAKKMNFVDENENVRVVDGVGRYMWLYNRLQGELGHYFRNLYHVIKFVKESDVLKNVDAAIEYKNRRRYTSLVRATLSQFELAMLFYNGVGDHGDKFKPLIEEFGLLENFDQSVLHNKKEDVKLYDPKAFK